MKSFLVSGNNDPLIAAPSQIDIIAAMLFHFILELVPLVGWDVIACDLKDGRDLVLHVLHLLLLVQILNLSLHSGLISRDLVANLWLLRLLSHRVSQLLLQFLDSILGMLAIVSDIS